MNQVIDFIDVNAIINKTGQEITAQLNNAVTLRQIIFIAFKLALIIAVTIVEKILEIRARPMDNKDKLKCPHCGSSLQSKGFSSRQIRSLIGLISWRRRVWRCPCGCKNGQIVPFDEQLGITPHQRISDEVKEMACMLAVFVPFQTASLILMALTGAEICPATIWNWVQIAGKKVIFKIEQELKDLSENKFISSEKISEEISKLIMAIGGDGVYVPFRPSGGKPEGKTQWKEVKVGIFARLGEKLTRNGKKVKSIVRKRVVAVLGEIDEFKTRMRLMAVKEGAPDAEKVAWLSDGGTGYWGVFNEIFSKYAHGILDFYHSVQNVYKGVKEWLGEGSKKANEWFASARHKIRDGHVKSVSQELKDALSAPGLSENAIKTLTNLIAYLDKHAEHMMYDQFKALGFPIGSGMVESTCKWLIQQRFKGVGMRWSEEGFNNLLHVRLAWVNETYHEIFLGSFPSPNS